MTEANSPLERAAKYWSTDVIDIEPGTIRVRGYPIEELIGRISFPDMIWLMLKGELPSAAQSDLLQAALVASVDHGPHAPSIAIARMAVTCGLPLNGAMASGLNTLDDIHGGAGEQAAQLYLDIDTLTAAGATLSDAIEQTLDQYHLAHGRFVPGFGHRFHPLDPRAPRLLQLVQETAAAGVIDGRFARIAQGVEDFLRLRRGKRIPMNIDGATAVIYTELGFPPPLARGIFCLSRAVGILTHAWEQSGRGERNKGPMPRQFPYQYTGQGPRNLPEVSV
jgi:citrate synthase